MFKLNYLFWRKLLAKFIIFSLCIPAVIAIFMFITESSVSMEVQITVSFLLIALFSATTLSGLQMLEKGNRYFKVVGLIQTILSLFLCVYSIFYVWLGSALGSTFNWTLVMISLLWIIGLSQISSILFSGKVRGDLKILENITVAIIFLFSIILTFIIWNSMEISNTMYRILGVIGILDVFGTMLTLALKELNNRSN